MHTALNAPGVARGPDLLHQIEAWVDRAASGHRSQPRRRPTHNVRGSSLSSGTRQPDDRCRRERGAAAVLIAPHARGAIQRSSARRRPPRTPKAAAGLGCSRIHLLHFFCPRSRALSAMQVRRSFLVRRRAGSRASRRGKGAGRDCARARRKSEEGGGSGVLGVAGTAPANDEPSSKVSVCRSRQGAIAGTRTSRSSTCRTPGAHLTRERDGPLCSLSLCGSVALVACRRRRPRRPRAQRPTGAGAVRASAACTQTRWCGSARRARARRRSCLGSGFTRRAVLKLLRGAHSAGRAPELFLSLIGTGEWDPGVGLGDNHF